MARPQLQRIQPATYSCNDTGNEVVIDLDLVHSSETVGAGGAVNALCSRSFTDWLVYHHFAEKYRSMFDDSQEREAVTLTKWYEQNGSDNCQYAPTSPCAHQVIRA